MVAGPVFKQVMQAALRLLDVPKDRPELVAPVEQDSQDESDAADPDPLVLQSRKTTRMAFLR